MIDKLPQCCQLYFLLLMRHKGSRSQSMQRCERRLLSSSLRIVGWGAVWTKGKYLGLSVATAWPGVCFELSNHVTTCPFGSMHMSMHKGLKLMPKSALERGQKVQHTVILNDIQLMPLELHCLPIFMNSIYTAYQNQLMHTCTM